MRRKQPRMLQLLLNRKLLGPSLKKPNGNVIADWRMSEYGVKL
jgi:hypothetical protein